MSRPSVGVALSGGAARGIAHAGVLKALKEHDIPIDYIAGSSAGSIVGAALAGGMTIDELEKLSTQLRWRKISGPTVSRQGFLSNKRLETYLRARLPKTRFEDLSIPFAAIATDLATGEAVVMKDRGDIPFAVRASCCIPGVYVPTVDPEGRQLVDGGLVAVLPALIVRSLGADIVISVDVNSAGATFFGSSLRTIVGVILQTFMVIQRTVTRHQHEASDVVITPKLSHIRWDQIRRCDELLAAGYEAGLAAIPEIKELLTNNSPIKQKHPTL